MTAAFVVALIGAGSAHADPIFEKYKVPTVGGAEINVEVMRPDGGARVPVILTYSPYNTLSEYTQPNLANDDLGQKYVPRGYARAVADVLGTRNSSGCWDYGGADEQQSGVDLVNFLSKRSWSSGKVSMIGVSYDGTTANMVAARGADAPGLVSIVPESAISRWYGYAYDYGVRYFGNSEVPSDEGIDTPLGFDFGLARTPPTDPTDPLFAQKLASRANPCESAEHTLQGYNRNPDYGAFWRERDYLKDAKNVRAAVLLAHGWQDYNVKQDEGVRMFNALGDKVPFKRAYFFQGSHQSPTGSGWTPLLDAFFEHTLKGVKNGVEKGPTVITQGRTVGADGYEDTTFRPESDWPPEGTRSRTLWLRGDSGALSEQPNREATNNVFSWFDTGAATEELTIRDPRDGADRGYALYFKSAPLAQNTRLAGRAVLDAVVRHQQGGAELAPLLVDVAPDGTVRTVERGFLNLDYRKGLQHSDPAPGEWVRAKTEFLPQDFTFQAGHRIGLIVEGSNTVWALPGSPGQADILTGPLPGVSKSGSRLQLPLVG